MKDWMWIGGLGWWGVLIALVMVSAGFALTGWLPGGTISGGQMSFREGQEGVGGPLGFLFGWVLKIAAIPVFATSFITAIGMAGAV